MDVYDQGDAALSSVLGLREVEIETLPDMALRTVLNVFDNFRIFRGNEFGRSEFAEIHFIHDDMFYTDRCLGRLNMCTV